MYIHTNVQVLALIGGLNLELRERERARGLQIQLIYSTLSLTGECGESFQASQINHSEPSPFILSLYIYMYVSTRELRPCTDFTRHPPPLHVIDMYLYV